MAEKRRRYVALTVRKEKDMKRYVNLDEISDGRLYEANDMVKADCGDCKGCSACCESMADTIILDPLDVYRLTANLGCSFQELLADRLELGVVDGIILPHMKMSGSGNRCSFLSPEGRCTIHSFRPGFCRLFPLGRYYENGSFRYFLQTHECKKETRTKVKVRKWIDTPDFAKYEAFVNDWHYFLKDLQEKAEQLPKGEASVDVAREQSLWILKVFYLTPYDPGRDFYEQYEERRGAVETAEG